MTLYVATAVACLLSYLICGVPFGLLIARTSGVDVRTVGSGNIGTTNVARSVGKGEAALTLGCDVGKGLICMLVARALIPLVSGIEWAAFCPGCGFGWIMSCVYLCCVLGHVFSPYLGFHGGKGIAVGFGGALGLCWPVALGIIAVFAVFAVPTRYVSLGSVCAAASLPLWSLVFGFSTASVLPVVAVAVVVIWAHRSNIKKLVNHEERKFSFHREDKGDRQ